MAFTISDLNDEKQLRRRAALTPCSSKDGLRRWFRLYLGLDFPDTLIDENSTGSPMDVFWEIYNAGVKRDADFPRRVMMYASRDSYKTLGASALELMAMLHMWRSVIHMAAIEAQAGKAQEYVRKFLDSEDLHEFLVGNNKRTVAVVWFEHKPTGNILTLDEWKVLGGRANIGQYVRHAYYIKVLVNTPQSANSDHVAFMVVDEVDLVRFPKAYEEAKLIPGNQRDCYGRDQPPITLLTSTRKSAGGLVQKEIDEAEDTGTRIHHWSVMDVTARCPDKRHRPDLPKVKVHRSDEDLAVLTPEQYQELLQRDRKKAEDEYVEDEMYGGCMVNCPLRVVAACRGRLAHQKSTAGLLKPVDDTVQKFRSTSIEMAIAQLLCLKPGNEGAIYKRLNKKKHLISPEAMWEEITGEPARGVVTKNDIIALLISRGAQAFAGLDWGYTHCFAVVLGFVEGRRMFIVDAFEVPGLEPNQCLELCDVRIKKYSPICWPDTAYPAYIKLFRKNGYVMREHKKDVVGGIEAVRSKLSPARGLDPELFMLKDDPGCEHLFKRLESYKWTTDPAGRVTDVPDETDDDLCDATRYVVQNVFRKDGKVVVERHTVVSPKPKPWNSQEVIREQMQAEINRLTGGAVEAPVGGERRIKGKGGFFASFE